MADYRAAGITVVGVSFDPPADNAAFKENKGYTFELWTDADKTLALALGAAANADQGHASRRTVLLDPTGQVVLTYDVGLGLGAHPGDVLDDARALFPAAPAPAPAAAPQP
jgi:peroxiredoxin